MQTSPQHCLGRSVTLLSGETGTVIGAAVYTEAEPQYLVRYVAADGCLTEAWWNAAAVTFAFPSPVE